MMILLTQRRLTQRRADAIRNAIDHPPSSWGWTWLRIRHGVRRTHL
jgi:hypothetical protein